MQNFDCKIYQNIPAINLCSFEHIHEQSDDLITEEF